MTPNPTINPKSSQSTQRGHTGAQNATVRLMQLVVVKVDGPDFGLSREAWSALRGLGHPLAVREPDRGLDDEFHAYCVGIGRDDLMLVAAVQTIGSKSGRLHAEWLTVAHQTLVVVEVPDGVDWVIESCPPREWVAERHRTWGR